MLSMAFWNMVQPEKSIRVIVQSETAQIVVIIYTQDSMYTQFNSGLEFPHGSSSFLVICQLVLGITLLKVKGMTELMKSFKI